MYFSYRMGRRVDLLDEKLPILPIEPPALRIVEVCDVIVIVQ